SWVFVLLPQLHRDPLWGDDPERFDPDRFEPAAVRKRPAHIFKPWGTGIRACIGRQFALHEAVLTLASLIRRYDFAPEPGYELDVHEAITLKPRGLKVKLSRQ
ncbi:cytochrome P450, partial [Rhodococcus pyridinivorans]|uniref:cytochrome P450 n=4 Tax=Nocardiaceae TaxID=85025 RepID=UPI002953C8DA